jgi:hypothetical protein
VESEWNNGGNHDPKPKVSPIDYNHPDIRSPGLESVWTGDNGEQGKEVVPQQQPNKYYPYPDNGPSNNPQEEERRKPRRFCGLPALWALLLLFLLILVLALGVGLGVGLGLKK